jgi:uncharacterized repeat protein (TIGR04052 family)
MKQPGALAAALALALLGAAPRERVSLHFAIAAGSAAVVCQAKIAGLGTTRAGATPQDVRFYVSEVRLVRADGGEVPVVLDDDHAWQAKGVALLSWCADGKADLHDVVTGTVPAGAYRGVRFALGIPDALNHADATIAEAPLNVTGMYWSWRSGYKFFRFDVRTSRENGVAPSTWLVHLGSTGCTTAAGGTYDCRHPNRPTIALQNFDWRSNVVVADIGRLVAGADLTAHSGGTQCMSDPSDDAECTAPFAALGLGRAAAAQTVFRVR